MIKRYSFDSEAQAQELILTLIPNKADEDSTLPDFKMIRVTETTQGIVVLAWQNKYGWDLAEDDENYLENREWVLIQEGLTYDVDVFWRDKVKYGWGIYEVEPKTPNHKFA